MRERSKSLFGTLSERAATRLRQLGWNGQASGNVEDCVSEVEASGFTVNLAARESLERLGGSEFHILDGGITWIRFDASEVRHTFYPDHIDTLAAVLGEPSCPIGAGAGYIVLICPSGKAALLHEQWFCLLVCDSMADLFEAILFGDRSKCEEFPDIESFRPE